MNNNKLLSVVVCVSDVQKRAPPPPCWTTEIVPVHSQRKSFGNSNGPWVTALGKSYTYVTFHKAVKFSVQYTSYVQLLESRGPPMTMSQINSENMVFKGGYKGVQFDKESHFWVWF